MKLKKIKVKPEKEKSKQSDKPPITWQEISQKYGRWILIVEVVLILVLGLAFIVKPKFDEVTSDTEGGLTYYQEELNDVQNDLVDVQKLVKLYNNLNKNEREKLFKVLPTGDQIPELMSQLEALFASEELFITGLIMTPQEIPAGLVSNFKTLEVQITIAAPQDYFHFKRVIEKLETNVRIMSINSMNYMIDSEELAILATAYYIE
jgi:Tfp pilus assembly protein PilO